MPAKPLHTTVTKMLHAEGERTKRVNDVNSLSVVLIIINNAIVYAVLPEASFHAASHHRGMYRARGSRAHVRNVRSNSTESIFTFQKTKYIYLFMSYFFYNKKKHTTKHTCYAHSHTFHSILATLLDPSMSFNRLPCPWHASDLRHWSFVAGVFRIFC